MMTNEYIKRKAAYNAIVNNYTTDEQLRDLDAIPPENVVPRDCYDRLLAENDELRKERPVVKGEWIRRCDSIFARCPNCGCEVMQLKSVVFCDEGCIDFCPNCGAELREES